MQKDRKIKTHDLKAHTYRMTRTIAHPYGSDMSYIVHIPADDVGSRVRRVLKKIPHKELNACCVSVVREPSYMYKRDLGVSGCSTDVEEHPAYLGRVQERHCTGSTSSKFWFKCDIGSGSRMLTRRT
eukprot:1877335-Amphidinium_carterae.1